MRNVRRWSAIALTQNFLFPFIATQSSANIFQANFNSRGNRSWNSKMKSFRASPRFIDGCSNLLWNFWGIKLMTRNRIFRSRYLQSESSRKLILFRSLFTLPVKYCHFNLVVRVLLTYLRENLFFQLFDFCQSFSLSFLDIDYYTQWNTSL